jgi:hypothetical protein
MKPQIAYSQKSTDVVRSILASLSLAVGVVLGVAALGTVPNASAAFLPPGRPVVRTNPAAFIADFSATLNGSLNPRGLPTTFHFEYGTTTNYGYTTAPRTRTRKRARPVSANIGGLTPYTTYHFRLVASNRSGTRYGSDMTFSTSSPSTCDIAGTWVGTVSGTWTSPFSVYCSWTGTAFAAGVITQNGTTISGSVEYDGIPCFASYICSIWDFAHTTGYIIGSSENCPWVSATYNATVTSGVCAGQSFQPEPFSLMLNGNTLSGTTSDGFTILLTRQP